MTLPHPDSADAAEAQLFGDALACDLEVAASFQPGMPSPAALQGAVATLRAVATIEDAGTQTADERHEAHQPLQRVEAKIDLMLGLLGRLAERDGPHMPILPVRWSYRGMRLEPAMSPAGAVPGASGTLVLRPATWLAADIELPARVLASADADGRHCLWLAFESMPDALADAMERHLFRLHRRQVAAQRNTTP